MTCPPPPIPPPPPQEDTLPGVDNVLPQDDFLAFLEWLVSCPSLIDLTKVFGYAKDAFKRLSREEAIASTLAFSKTLRAKAEGKRKARQAQARTFNAKQYDRLSNRDIGA